jgi:hypothetical protein
MRWKACVFVADFFQGWWVWGFGRGGGAVAPASFSAGFAPDFSAAWRAFSAAFRAFSASRASFAAAFSRAWRAASSSFLRQHCLYFRPEPHGHFSLRPTGGSAVGVTLLASVAPLYSPLALPAIAPRRDGVVLVVRRRKSRALAWVLRAAPRVGAHLLRTCSLGSDERPSPQPTWDVSFVS